MKKRYLITYSFKGDERDQKVKDFSVLLASFKLDFTTEQEDQSTYFGNSNTASKAQFDEERNRLLDEIRKFVNKYLDGDDFIHFFYPEKNKDVADLYKVVIKKEKRKLFL